jgi:hypothetical protein
MARDDVLCGDFFTHRRFLRASRLGVGQRGWKQQPRAGSSALENSPVIVNFSCL